MARAAAAGAAHQTGTIGKNPDAVPIEDVASAASSPPTPPCRHPEHIDKLEWLALTNAAEFDPTRFNAKELTSALEYLPLD